MSVTQLTETLAGLSMKPTDQLFVEETVLDEIDGEPELSQADKLIVELLEVIDKYEKQMSRLGSCLRNGYLDLSRANYASTAAGRRFGRDFYDEREFEAQFKVSIKDGKLMPFSESVQTESTVDSEENANILKHRKRTKEEEVATTTALEHPKSDIKHMSEVEESRFKRKDPINMFGALVPYQLKQSQISFRQGVACIAELVSTQRRLYELLKLINK